MSDETSSPAPTGAAGDKVQWGEAPTATPAAFVEATEAIGAAVEAVRKPFNGIDDLTPAEQERLRQDHLDAMAKAAMEQFSRPEFLAALSAQMAENEQRQAND